MLWPNNKFYILRGSTSLHSDCMHSPITQCFHFYPLMMQSFDGGSKQMLNGTMVHEVFQRAATAKDFSLETLSKLAEQTLNCPQYLGDM